MLNSDTKRRIDSCRDLLVGKVPDPKSQVEQITIALIYKFMDDMDSESEELGGARSFFVGDFAQYAWSKLLAPGVGAQQTLNQYQEAITRMTQNQGLPPLFREIFRNAYLPYRDPETLKSFLKEIDGFTYDHSEELGDAFEYLLSVLGSQGDAGQFRTPRHIIDFMVKVVDPKKGDRILDPACGTAGFLISAYKHILAANTDAETEQTLTADEKGLLAQNVHGYDISPDMVRLSLVNMYLHGFVDPHIEEYDTLTQEDRWGDNFDVILANPPFMSPKGGIKPHKRFSIQANRSEVLFVDYMAEHLSSNGRAGIIVPEGIIFQKQTAYEKLRKMLIEGFLIGVISLPSGVFMPYTGVKTSILILDRGEAKRNPTIMFSDIRHIGLSLGVKRTVSEHNDLPYVLSDYRAYYRKGELSRHSWLAPRESILTNGCNLSGARYRPKAQNGIGRITAIGEVCAITKGKSSSTTTTPGPYRLVLTAADSKTSNEYQFNAPAVCVPLISSLGHGRAALHRIHYAEGKFALANLLVALQPNDPKDLDVRFLYHALDSRRSEIAMLMQGAANVGMKPEDLSQFDIPLPPLEVQKEIVAEIEGYQKVINGARAVLENYRPTSPIHPNWPMVELGQACVVNPKKSEVNNLQGSTVVSFVPMADLGEHEMFFEPKETKRLDEVTTSYTYFKDGDVLLAKVTPCFENGKSGIARDLLNGIGFGSSELFVLRPMGDLLPQWVFLFAASPAFRAWATPQMTGTGGLQRVPRSAVESYPIPVPPLATQQAIVAEIEAEQALVAANRELITRFEQKIQTTVVRIWGDTA